MRVAAITGHRPEKIPNVSFMRTSLRLAFASTELDHIIQGMAAGVDLASAHAAHTDGIGFTCAIPWRGHKPRKEDQEDYYNALRYADDVVYVDESEEYPGPWVYHKRNEYMVDHADFLIAYWDGSPGGGTASCVSYARNKIPIYNINPTKGTRGWLGRAL